MSDLKERLKLVLKTLHIKNIEFSEATGFFNCLYFYDIESRIGINPVAPSASVYKAVQREYNINPDGLKKGREKCFVQRETDFLLNNTTLSKNIIRLLKKVDY